mgnify:CR=1 FL=1
MKVYKIGIIGYGGFGKFLHHWWDKLEGVEVVAISNGKAEDELGVVNYDDWRNLIEDAEIDIVSVATPPASHVEIACACMLAGKHVLLEKPAAINREGIETLQKVQRETGKSIMVNHMLRYNPIVDSLIKLSKDEVFGKLRHASVTNYAQDNSLPPTHWFWDREISGGIFVEHGVHFFDIINALTAQRVEEVCGLSHRRNEIQQDQMSAMVLYNDGLIANHYHSFSGPGFFEDTTIRLMYDLAKIEIQGWIPLKGKIKALVNQERHQSLQILPELKVVEKTPITNLVDTSRPEGWGDLTETLNSTIESGGISYDASEMLTAEFGLSEDKSEVYGSCVQAILVDLMAMIENPSHQPKVSIENAFEALKVALMADEQLKSR